MNKIYIFILFMICSGIATAQHTNENTFRYVEQMPECPYDLPGYLSKNIRYPDEAIKKNIEGRVYIEFVINADGTITEPSVKKSAHPLLDAEALRVVAAMPPWKPGKQNGRAVDVFFALPVKFQLDGVVTDTTKFKTTR